jgi:hypothetical protein
VKLVNCTTCHPLRRCQSCRQGKRSGSLRHRRGRAASWCETCRSAQLPDWQLYDCCRHRPSCFPAVWSQQLQQRKHDGKHDATLSHRCACLTSWDSQPSSSSSGCNMQLTMASLKAVHCRSTLPTPCLKISQASFRFDMAATEPYNFLLYASVRNRSRSSYLSDAQPFSRASSRDKPTSRRVKLNLQLLEHGKKLV